MKIGQIKSDILDLTETISSNGRSSYPSTLSNFYVSTTPNIGDVKKCKPVSRFLNPIANNIPRVDGLRKVQARGGTDTKRESEAGYIERDKSEFNETQAESEQPLNNLPLVSFPFCYM